MNFKRMELAGFKSFADKTTIKFDGGVTAIVGPNGCGKSNVADAIRWVLGEQRSKMLRGSSMQDVIFNGTEKRKSLSYTEVSLVFDNTNRTFDIEYDEVIMTRKLYRSGESAYYINKTPCRLKDITLLLHDSGIGKEGYSIIGQGKVEEILSAKPENRRAIFEEAAGISKFKAKKTDAERKLNRTRDNLTRINDIVLEIERQLNPLKEQSETAKEYLKLRDTAKELELNNYIYKYDNAATEKNQLQIKINAIKEEIASKQKALEEASTDYDKTYAAIEDADKENNRLHAEVLRLTVDLEKRSGDVGVLKEKLTHLKTEGERLFDEIKTAEKEHENNEEILKEKRVKLNENNVLLNSLRDRTEDVSTKYFEVVDELTKSEDEAQNNQEQIVSALSELSDVKANLSAYNAEKKALLLRHQEVLVASKQKEAELTINKNTKALTENNITNAKKQKQILQEEYEKGSKNYNLLSKTLADLKEDYMQTSASVVSMQNRRKMLIEMQNSYEGLSLIHI